MKLTNPLCVALDVDTADEALAIARELRGQVGAFKVGPRLTNIDSTIVQKLAEEAPVFVDHKYYDIPSTMEAAVKSAFSMGATFATIHASAGSTALSLMAKLEIELNQKRPFKILAVTILTSFSQKDLPDFVQSTPIGVQVEHLAKLSLANGVTGLVCSPQEIQQIRQISREAFIVTPGIRSSNQESGDQSRTMSAAQALRAGANLLVVGRPIVKASNRRVAVENLLKEMA